MHSWLVCTHLLLPTFAIFTGDSSESPTLAEESGRLSRSVIRKVHGKGPAASSSSKPRPKKVLASKPKSKKRKDVTPPPTARQPYTEMSAVDYSQFRQETGFSSQGMRLWMIAAFGALRKNTSLRTSIILCPSLFARCNHTTFELFSPRPLLLRLFILSRPWVWKGLWSLGVTTTLSL